MNAITLLHGRFACVAYNRDDLSLGLGVAFALLLVSPRGLALLRERSHA
jgi:hypothetical protein